MAIAATKPKPPPIPSPGQRARMTGWYDPRQLLRTGLDVMVSTAFARNADRRLTEARTLPPSTPIDYSQGQDALPPGELVLDFVADTGDGWNSTYAVARLLSQPELRLAGPNGKGEHRIRRGDLLVMGGDEVYPAASADRYQQKLVAPFRLALPHTDAPHPQLFAIPGNHDWFDNLVAFSQLFISRTWLGGRQLRQDRSYFACKLRPGWWLLGVDVQLQSDVDQLQIEYFKKVAGLMSEDDAIVLCTPEPHWVYEGEPYSQPRHQVAARNLRFLEEHVFKGRIRAYLSGDQHHYRRHASPEGVQKITAGGGGAFLHPTHGWNQRTLEGGFELKKAFPETRTSWLLGLRNLLFPLWNPWFMAVTAVAYLLVYLTVAATLAAWPPGGGGTAWSAVSGSLMVNPGALLAILAVLGGFYAFTDTSAAWYRIVGGLSHGATHLAAAFGIACGVRTVTGGWRPAGSLGTQVAAIAAQVVLGGLVGAFIMGLYLFVSLNVFKRHRNEAFSALRIQDYKNFLRLRFGADGTLTIFPVGIRRVPRRWVEEPGPHGPTLEPAKGQSGAGEARLIEEPIRVTR